MTFRDEMYTPGSLLGWTTLQILLDVWNSYICEPTPKSELRTFEKYELFTQVQSLTAIYLFIIPQRHLLCGLL